VEIALAAIDGPIEALIRTVLNFFFAAPEFQRGFIFSPAENS
jgi:hypothetical protein